MYLIFLSPLIPSIPPTSSTHPPTPHNHHTIIHVPGLCLLLLNSSSPLSPRPLPELCLLSSYDSELDKKPVVHLHNGLLLCSKREGTFTYCNHMNGPAELYAK